MIDKYINFFNIYILLYSDLKLLDVKQENFSIIFKEDIDKINYIFSKYIKVEVIDNNFLIDFYNKDNDLSLLCSILKDYNSFNYNTLKTKKKISIELKNELIYFFYFVEKTFDSNGDEMTLELNYYKDKSFLIFNLFNALFTTFRGEKNLFNSIEYINKLLTKYKFSIFYLFRIRNLFLYFYQTVIGRKIFYNYMLNDKKKILDSKYMKIIFSDFLKAKKVNENNNIINLFEGFIYLHLLDKKGVEILNPFLGIPGNDVDILISNYYLDIGKLDLAEKILISKKTNKNFKYYRKIFPIYTVLTKK